MPDTFDVAAVGNAIVDVISTATDDFLGREGLAKGAMMLIDAAQAEALYTRMGPGLEASGGSAGNTVAGVASFGGRAAYIGKVADDALGRVFRHDITAQGVHFEPRVRQGASATGRCLVNVTPDGQRTMCTFLGAACELDADDVTAEVVAAANLLYLEGYLFDPPGGRAAFAKAAGIARNAGRRIALSLSDAFVAERHREALLAFIDSDVDVVFANEAEVTALFQTSDFEAAARAMADKVEIAALTRGAEGSVILGRDGEARAAAEPVEKVVDTTGAGDQYAAGVLFGLARGLPLEACARLGSIAAAEVIGHYGPRPQAPLKALAKAAGIA